ncbi:hypothetical protein [Acidovorax sp. NCPPB 4044]|uniref:hypothetical protein n=1 Tax=Acidovorax sp. NCPPB 4044 TaxID=2940490 RepID=UPI00230266DF|nr:hypothetical protein [Acidovorax sp. NCPPB 4044]MDA8523534.1 hypothetical protein [Acidovorax sp. NCPPB 4044]
MSAELAATFYTMGYAQSVAQSMENNQADILVLTPNQYFSILQDKSRHNPRLENTLRAILANTAFGQYWTQTVSPNTSELWVGPTAQSANDALAITKTLNAIGMAGIKSYVKSTASGTYIIIKGYAAHRSGALTGTRYLATNPIMMKLGLGMKGLGDIAKGGFILGVTVSTGIEIMDFIFNNEKTMYDLVGGIGVEAVKGGLGALAAYAAANMIGLAFAVAIGPVVTMAFAAFVVGVGLNIVDQHYQIKTKVIAALEKAASNIKPGFYSVNEKSSSWISDVKTAVRAGFEEKSRKVNSEIMDWLCPICRR